MTVQEAGSFLIAARRGFRRRWYVTTGTISRSDQAKLQVVGFVMYSGRVWPDLVIVGGDVSIVSLESTDPGALRSFLDDLEAAGVVATWSPVLESEALASESRRRRRLADSLESACAGLAGTPGESASSQSRLSELTATMARHAARSGPATSASRRTYQAMRRSYVDHSGKAPDF